MLFYSITGSLEDVFHHVFKVRSQLHALRQVKSLSSSKVTESPISDKPPKQEVSGLSPGEVTERSEGIMEWSETMEEDEREDDCSEPLSGKMRTITLSYN